MYKVSNTINFLQSDLCERPAIDDDQETSRLAFLLSNLTEDMGLDTVPFVAGQQVEKSIYDYYDPTHNEGFLENQTVQHAIIKEAVAKAVKNHRTTVEFSTSYECLNVDQVHSEVIYTLLIVGSGGNAFEFYTDLQREGTMNARETVPVDRWEIDEADSRRELLDQTISVRKLVFAVNQPTRKSAEESSDSNVYERKLATAHFENDSRLLTYYSDSKTGLVIASTVVHNAFLPDSIYSNKHVRAAWTVETDLVKETYYVEIRSIISEIDAPGVHSHKNDVLCAISSTGYCLGAWRSVNVDSGVHKLTAAGCTCEEKGNAVIESLSSWGDVKTEKHNDIIWNFYDKSEHKFRKTSSGEGVEDSRYFVAKIEKKVSGGSIIAGKKGRETLKVSTRRIINTLPTNMDAMTIEAGRLDELFSTTVRNLPLHTGTLLVKDLENEED